MARTRGAGNPPDDTAAGRVPPHDLEAEKAVLSAILLDNHAMDTVCTEVGPDDFYHPAHQALLRAMRALKEGNQPVDLHTLSDHLNTAKRLDEIGGPVFLAEIADYEATAAHAEFHARIVRDKSIKRRLISAATEIAESAFEQSDDAEHLLDLAEAKVLEIGQQRGRVTFQDLRGEMQTTFDYIEQLMERGDELTGVPTGFRDLDDKTAGLQGGELIVLASRPSMGKTALALNIARNAAVDHGKKVAIFSLEMTSRSLVLRLLSGEAQVDFSNFRRFHSSSDYRMLQEAAGRLTNAQICIDDSGMITGLEMKAKARRLASERGLDLVIVDYLQLAHGDNRTQRKDLEIAEISHGLKALAKELDIPVIAVSQLNRGPEQRDPDKRRPNMGDLRESGAIEQDADVILFIYRDVVYNKDTTHPQLAELILAKQRNGPIATVHLHFNARFAQFRDWSERDDGPLGAGSGGFGGVEPFEPGAPMTSPEPPF